MKIWNSVRDIFQRGIPSTSSIFKAACRHGSRVNFSFMDSERLPRNVSCHIENLRKHRIYLKLYHPLPSGMLSHDVCNLFFKLPPETLRYELGIKSDTSQNGFLCKSRIQDYDSDSDKLCRHICVSLPARYTRRELRKHERHGILAGMVSQAGLWILEDSGNPASKTPDFIFAPGRLCSLGLINISAGGAKVILDNMDFIEQFANIESANLILRLSLNIAADETLNTWLICRCIGSHYSIRLRRLSMRLRFLNPSDSCDNAFMATVGSRIDKNISDAIGAGSEDSARLLNWLSMWNEQENWTD